MGFFPEGEDGEKFRKDMRALGMASSFSTATAIGIFCMAKFIVAAPHSGYGWLAASIAGFAGGIGSLYELKNYFNEVGKGNPPKPSSPPSLKLGQPKL